MSNHDGPYLLQAAVSSYLTTNKTTYASGAAASLPVVQAGDFGDRGRDHIYIMVEQYRQDPPRSGSFAASVMVGIATLRETSLSTHQSYCRAIFDLLMEEDLATYLSGITGNKIRVYQVEDDHDMSLGAVTDGLRFAQVTFSVRCYLAA